MKKNLLLLAAFIVLVAGSFENVKAQQTQTTIVGATHTYSVTQSAATGTSTYDWTGSVTSGSGMTYTFGTTNSNSVVFNTATAVGVPYVISVAERSSNGCPDPTPQTISVTVLANNLTIEFASDGVAPNYARGGCSAAAGDLTLGLSLGGNIPHPCSIVVNYTVGGVANSRTITSTSATTASIDLGSEDNILTNTTTSDITRNVVITSASVGGAPMTLGTQSTYAYTAWLTPATSTITVTP